MSFERRANDEDARLRETELAKEQTHQAESRDEPGIYVYALPHYLRYPFEPGTGRTLLKGRSQRQRRDQAIQLADADDGTSRRARPPPHLPH